MTAADLKLRVCGSEIERKTYRQTNKQIESWRGKKLVDKEEQICISNGTSRCGRPLRKNGLLMKTNTVLHEELEEFFVSDFRR